jgi:hypothetical protein
MAYICCYKIVKIMINNLKTQKICYDNVTYNDISLNEEWLKRNNFYKISSKHESSWASPVKVIIVTKNDGTEILLKSDDECNIFFDKYK